MHWNLLILNAEKLLLCCLTCRNVVSYSDGLTGAGTGIPYFYLTSLDPTARNALENDKASLTVSEYPLGTCGTKDPMNPTCSKISLTGKVCEELKFIQYDHVDV